MSTIFRKLNINHGLPDKHEENRDGVTEVGIVGVQTTRRAVGNPAYGECTERYIHKMNNEKIDILTNICKYGKI
jgi:hypothetical protein